MASRVTQLPTEVAIKPSTTNLRVSQSVLEVTNKPSTTNLRASQLVLEVVITSKQLGAMRLGPVIQVI